MFFFWFFFAVQKGQVCLNSHIITHFNSEKKNLYCYFT